MLTTIAQKEFSSTLRDRRFVGLSLLVLALLLAAMLVSRRGYAALQQERAAAQHTVNEQFAYQPGWHPHRVAHYGSFAFRPKAGLSFLDAGIDSFIGAAVYLEAHQQISALPSRRARSSGLASSRWLSCCKRWCRCSLSFCASVSSPRSARPARCAYC